MNEDLWRKMTQPTSLEQLLKVEKIPNVKKIEKNIWVIENFITDQTLKIYKDYIKTLEEEDWWKKGEYWWIGKYIPIDSESPLRDVSLELISKTKEIIQDDIHLGAYGSLHRLTAGQGMFIHTDNPTEKRLIVDENKNQVGETIGHNNYCILGMVLYLSDFNGGNIYFPALGVEYHGKSGDLVIFPGTGKDYDHGVREVEEGPNRYITTAFGYDRGVEPLRKANRVFEDVNTGEFTEFEPSKVDNDPKEAMKLPPRSIE